VTTTAMSTPDSESEPNKPQSATGRLIAISNRLPVKLQNSAGVWRAEVSTGGLATAMNPILKRSDGLWIGWPGSSTDIGNPARQKIIADWAVNERLIAVDLPPDVARNFYEGYANQILWPLFHYFPSRMASDPQGWAAYVAANKMFCDVAVRNYRDGDTIWVHDYQLMLLPALLREALPGAPIGFFLHIPFPSSEVFRIVPERAELLEGLLGADLLAFQTYSHLQHFRSSLLRIVGRESRIDQVDLGARAVRIAAVPIGIAPEAFSDLLQKRETLDHIAALQRRHSDRRILLAVDRLDYSKGIPDRLRTYRRLLESAPELRGKVVLIQVAVPSREKVFTYEALRRQVNELVGEINGQFGTEEWTPVLYIRRGISRPQLVALYNQADVAWVTPLRDGMNLVSKEFVACQKEKNGILLLSEFAGAAEEMGEAFQVNPYDEGRTAAVLRSALETSPEERAERLRALRERVERNNVFAWSERFLALLQQAAETRASYSDQPAPLDFDAIVRSYCGANRRLLLLDYDGTLVPFANRPEGAVPPPQLKTLLVRLTADPRNLVALVSGRSRADLEQWFGDIAGLCLVAEHGAIARYPAQTDWAPLRLVSSRDWMKRVRPVFEHFVNRTPGSFIEEKEYALVWHYRLSAPEFGEWLARELVSMLEGMLAETELRAVRGRKIVEVKPLWIQKGAAAERLARDYGADDFQFAAGDDRTDEDAFEVLPESAWTVHVGSERSRARFSVSDPDRMVELLGRFADGR
jgi:trehalose 6-phosphate synthase/phosphatase